MAGKLEDGFKTLIEFAENPTVKLYEIEVTPAGIDGGGGHSTTTMRNTAWRTEAPSKLKSLTEGGSTVAYETECLAEMNDMINVKQLITVTFPDGDTWKFWGWVNSFIPNALVEGEMPTAELSILPSNANALGVEVPPVWAAFVAPP